MNNQEAFETIIRHLMNQKRRCATDNGECYYRHPFEPGLKCAAGALIPDEYYEEQMERRGIGSLIDTNEGRNGRLQNDIKKLFMGIDLNLLTALQGMHDNVNPGLWKQKLYVISMNYNLDNTILGEFEDIPMEESFVVERKW